MCCKGSLSDQPQQPGIFQNLLQDTNKESGRKEPAFLSGAYCAATAFCSIIALAASLLYLLLGYGLSSPDSALLLITCTGAGFSLLFVPLLLSEVSAWTTRSSDSTLQLSISQMALFFLPGMLGRADWPGPVNLVFTWVICLTGYGATLYFWISFIRNNLLYRIAYVFLPAVLFSMWALSRTLRPALTEGIVAGITRIDHWYNIVMAQMIKTYNVPGTGIDGTPWFYYHYGSHWYMAQLSKVTDNTVPALYAVGYSILLVPLSFQAFLHFSLGVRRMVPGPGDKAGYIPFSFGLLFLCIFIQVIKNLYSGVMLGYRFPESESFVTRFTLFSFFLPVRLSFWQHQQAYSGAVRRIFLWVILPGIAAIIDFLKISVLYIFAYLAGYLFLRLRLYRRLICWISLLLAGSALIVYYCLL